MQRGGAVVAGRKATGQARAVRGAAGGRARILAEARAAFVARGFADVSMQEIADAAGLTKAAIYYHFADKEALFAQVLAAELGRLASGIAAQLAPGPPLRDQLERVARYALASGRGDFGRLVGEAHQFCDRDMLHALREQMGQPFGMIRVAFVQAKERGEIRDGIDVDVTLALFFSMVGGQLKGAQFGMARDIAPEALAAAVADLVMRGIGAEA